MTELINIILVPQGAEYQAVCAGLKQSNTKPSIFPIPVGIKAVTPYIKQLQQTNLITNQRVLVMGLCGSLSPQYTIGDLVLYRDCLYAPNSENYLILESDRPLTDSLANKLSTQPNLVRGLTSDRVIWSSKEKANLRTSYQRDVVDMEGYAILKVLSQAGVAVATIRVISDSYHGNIPNLNSAISSDGQLKTLPLVYSMLRQPLAAARLIKGAMSGLKVLQKVTTNLFCS